MIGVSILVSPLGSVGQTQACLESLWKTLPPRFSGEVLAFHPPGFEPSAHPLLRLLPPNVSVTGSAVNHNALARAAREPLLLFLSPGAVTLPGWLPPLLALLRRAPRAGIIGNVQREPYSGLIDHAGLRFSPAGLPVPVAHSHPLLPGEPVSRHPAVSFACALLKRELFDQLDGFDECFHGPLGEVDLCLRAASLGRRHYVANRSVIYHDAGASPGQAVAEDLVLFRALWGDRARAAHVRRAALRSDLSAPPFSFEAWEMAREDRRTRREAVRLEHKVGYTYLRKHLHRPWRYNAGRLGLALAKALQPLPPVLPINPASPFRVPEDPARPDDGWLFDPPLR